MELAPTFDFALIWNFFSSVIFHVIIFCTALYYVYKKQGADGFLIAAGSFIHIITSTFYSLILPLMVSRSGSDFYNTPFLMPAFSIISFIGSLLFIIGLIILIINHLTILKRLNETDTPN
jgi:hypothetical protein